MALNAATVLAIVGLCFLLLGLICTGLIFPKLEVYLLKKATSLQEGNEAYENWINITFPFKFKVYFFNVSNPEEVLQGAKPILKEIGPYIYEYLINSEIKSLTWNFSEIRKREIVSVDEEKDTITFIQKKNYYFNQEESGCRNQDDIVTILDFALLSTADKVNKLGALSLLEDVSPHLFPNRYKIFIRDQVRKILFDGLLISCQAEETEILCDGIRSKTPHTLRPAENNQDFLLSLFHHINGSEDGPYEIYRGVKDTPKGEILSFKNQKKITLSNECNEITGTDLTVNPFLGEPPTKHAFFIPDFCRTFSVNFTEEILYAELKTYLFKTANLFENDCDNGTLNLVNCTGSSVILSAPEGSYNRETFIMIEPRSGVALKVSTKIQMNMFLQHFEEFTLFNNVTDGLFPFIWFENGATVPDLLIKKLQNNLNQLKFFEILKYLLISLGVFLLLVAIIFAIIKDKVICKSTIIQPTRIYLK